MEAAETIEADDDTKQRQNEPRDKSNQVRSATTAAARAAAAQTALEEARTARTVEEAELRERISGARTRRDAAKAKRRQAAEEAEEAERKFRAEWHAERDTLRRKADEAGPPESADTIFAVPVKCHLEICRVC